MWRTPAELEGDREHAIQLVDVEAFGHKFENVVSGIANDLVTLEKEGAIYTHLFNHEIGQYQYCRIPLLPAETFQYVEGALGQQQFDRAMEKDATFEEALAAITNSKVRELVRAYRPFGGEPAEADIRGCFASFLPSELEKVVCGVRWDRVQILPELGGVRDRLSLIIKMLDSFPIVARGLAERGHNRPPIKVVDEYDVQDILFACLRAVFQDARREDHTPQLAGRSRRIDIVVPSVQTAIEVKCVRDRRHAQRVADELMIDCESYHSHPQYEHLLFLVYDPNHYIVDPPILEDGLSGQRTKNDHSFEVQVMVRS
jgi:REase_DpnII-MboI